MFVEGICMAREDVLEVPGIFLVVEEQKLLVVGLFCRHSSRIGQYC